jgi:hypothetical protein
MRKIQCMVCHQYYIPKDVKYKSIKLGSLKGWEKLRDKNINLYIRLSMAAIGRAFSK